jgi:hypothetical protein
VDTQIARIRAIDARDVHFAPRREADAQFLVVALWRLRMAAVMCQE